MLSSQERATIDRLLYEVEDAGEVVNAVASMSSAEQLFRLALDYNWDDGFRVPDAISDHPLCDLATALLLFWRGGAIEHFEATGPPSESEGEWVAFSRKITDRLLSGHYKPGVNGYDPPLTKVQKYKLRKRGVPELLLAPVGAEGPEA
jgi:hypothetical protein